MWSQTGDILLTSVNMSFGVESCLKESLLIPTNANQMLKPANFHHYVLRLKIQLHLHHGRPQVGARKIENE